MLKGLKIESALVITKLIFNYYNNIFVLEMTSEVENVAQTCTYTILYFHTN